MVSFNIYATLRGVAVCWAPVSDRHAKLYRDFSADCLIHLITLITCWHPLVTLKSRLGLEEQQIS